MKQISLLAGLLMLLCLPITAQNDSTATTKEVKKKKVRTIELYGEVYDSFTKAKVKAFITLMHNDSTIVPLYGLLYNWTAAGGGAPVLNICPERWHLPSMNEWNQLTSYVLGQSQYWCESNGNHYIAKSLASTIGWGPSSTPCAVGNNITTNNATGFGAMPAGGFGAVSSGYYDFTGGAYFWTPDRYNSDYCHFDLTQARKMPDVSHHHPSYYGLSVRCIHD